jgi:hypothetical protein
MQNVPKLAALLLTLLLAEKNCACNVTRRSSNRAANHYFNAYSTARKNAGRAPQG